MSKDSCEMCSVALAKRNDLWEGWLLADGHHQVYQCLLQNFYNTSHNLSKLVTASMIDAVEKYLHMEITRINSINQSPVHLPKTPFGAENDEVTSAIGML